MLSGLVGRVVTSPTDLAAQVGALVTATLLGSAALTLGVGLVAHRLAGSAAVAVMMSAAVTSRRWL